MANLGCPGTQSHFVFVEKLFPLCIPSHQLTIHTEQWNSSLETVYHFIFSLVLVVFSLSISFFLCTLSFYHPRGSKVPCYIPLPSYSLTVFCEIGWHESPDIFLPRPEQPLGRASALSRLGAELELRRSGSSLGPSQ